MGLLPFRGEESRTQRARDKKGNTTHMSKRLSISRKHLLLLGLTAILLLVMACAPDAKQSTFGTSGPVAEKQLLLFNVLLWVMVAVFILVEGVLLYAVIKFRRRPGQTELPPQTHGHTALEITWTIIPTILILGLGIWSTITLFELDQPPAGADTLEVTAVGHQWWWEFEYPDADGNGKRITTANELRIPVDKAIRINLRSDDIIHSFWVPKLAGKVDVVPTRENYMWFQADETGIFYGQCAEFCGTAHAQMRFLVQVLPQEDYLAWAEGFGEAPVLSAQAQAGQTVFNGTGGCVVCHTANGSDSDAVVAGRVQGFMTSDTGIAPGPNLTDLATRVRFGAGIVDLNRQNLRQWLRDPETVKPGNYMSERAAIYQTADGRASLSESDISSLLEYLLSLK
ncbi:MAG: cytochrome c oxidase subunit II [Chloroflexi bacterium]|nr:cytochrome c oxidase subunit II [Chloroflexota bacterium]